MKIAQLTEPELEFGGDLRHIDPRAGISAFGPADANAETAPRAIQLGLVGDAAGLDGLRGWLDRCRGEVSGKETHQQNLFPSWPGFDVDRAFRSTIVFDDRACREISQPQLRSLKRLPMAERVRELVEVYVREIESLADDGRVAVIVCIRPDELLDVDDDDAGTDDDEGQEQSAADFHDLLKARAMRFNRPIQLVRPRTFGLAQRRRKMGRNAGAPLQIQDEATRAWNLHAALYYKAGGSPWRLRSARTEPTSCFVGISFFETLDGSSLHTGVAQVFNELGDGVVVRGGQAKRSKRDRQVHLAEADANELLGEALERYRQYHHTLPARVVVHKSSAFNDAESSGFFAAADTRGIHATELVWIPRREDVRLFRLAANPPLRGSLLSLTDEHHVLYTKGSVPYYATYPGMYVPQPIGLRLATVERSGRQLAEEVLALTKLNWNNTQFDGREPVTLRIADRVGSILRYLSPDQSMVARYAFYM